jgi:hypothetical protein
MPDFRYVSNHGSSPRCDRRHKRMGNYGLDLCHPEAQGHGKGHPFAVRTERLPRLFLLSIDPYLSPLVSPELVLRE